MSLFSRKTNDHLTNSTDTGRAARSADQRGEHVTAGAYQAQSDDSFQQWLAATEAEWQQSRRNS